MKKLFLVPICLCLIAADPYRFPEGLPFKASDVTFYGRATSCQDERGGFKGLGQQSWNLERPWINAGMEDSPNATTFKFRSNATQRSREWNESARFFSNGGFYRRWEYEPGSLFGEVIQADGRTVEVFTLEFVAGKREPVFHRYRPFTTREEIAQWITGERVTQARYGDRHGVENPRRQIGKGGQDITDLIARDPVIEAHGLRHEIELSREGVQAVLARPFKDVIDKPFSERDGLKAFGPTTKQNHGIVPINSRSGLFSSQSCLACHRTAGAEGRLLDPNPRPDKYGAIRGNGFVFSEPPRGR